RPAPRRATGSRGRPDLWGPWWRPRGGVEPPLGRGGRLERPPLPGAQLVDEIAAGEADHGGEDERHDQRDPAREEDEADLHGPGVEDDEEQEGEAEQPEQDQPDWNRLCGLARRARGGGRPTCGR